MFFFCIVVKFLKGKKKFVKKKKERKEKEKKVEKVEKFAANLDDKKECVIHKRNSEQTLFFLFFVLLLFAKSIL